MAKKGKRLANGARVWIWRESLKVARTPQTHSSVRELSFPIANLTQIRALSAEC